MRQMVTSGFYDRSYIGLWLFEVIGREYDDMAMWAREVRREAFPQTCTWSIAIWEFVYGIDPDDTLPLDFRRERILSRRLSRPPINPARIEATLSALTGEPVSITENVAPYTFAVTVGETDETIYDFRAALKQLRQMKPSHLSFSYESHIVVEFTVTDYIGAALNELLREYFVEESVIITDVVDYDAGAYAERMREYVIGDESPIQTEAAAYSAGATNERVKEAHTEWLT